MKILCTGSAGFICGKLITRLQTEGHEVTGFDKVNGQDICNLAQVRESVKDMDAVFHLAAVADLNYARANPEETWAINTDATFNIAMACAESGAKLYFSSTCCRYGNQEVHPSTELSLPHPSEIYACSKVAAENAVMAAYYNSGRKLQYNIMAFATIYGPGTRPALGTHIFLGQALRGEPITVHGDGKQTRTITYVDDLVDGIIALFNSGKMNDAWNLSIEEEVSALQMAEDIKAITHSDSPIIHIPQRPGQTFRELISAEKMYREVGWRAKVPWKLGLQQMYSWFIETHQIKNKYVNPIKEGVTK